MKRQRLRIDPTKRWEWESGIPDLDVTAVFPTLFGIDLTPSVIVAGYVVQETSPTGIASGFVFSESGIPIDVAVFFVIGLLGGAHCLGMCGPFVTLYAERLDDGTGRVGWNEIRQHLLFNVGRTGSYALIGGVMGALGTILYDAAAIVSIADRIRGIVGIVVGLAIVVTGAGYAYKGTMAFSEGTPGTGRLFSRVFSTISGRVNKWVAGPGIVGLGMLHGLLPCPILYPAFLAAFARGSPVMGGISLALLGLGTFPTLFAYGTVFQSLSPATRVRLHRALGVVFLVLGYLPLSMGLASIGVPVPRIRVPFYQPLG